MRMNAFNDSGLGEPEQDANTALIELDKGSSSLLTFPIYLAYHKRYIINDTYNLFIA